MATFNDGTIIHFGLRGGSTYIDNHDKKKRLNYIKKHQVNEKFNNYKSAGALSRLILWGNDTDINVNIKTFKNKYLN